MLVKTTPVRELMSTTVLFARTDHGLLEVSRLFDQMGIHHLPVINDAGQIIGMLSANDALKALTSLCSRANGPGLADLENQLSVEELMTPPPIRTIHPDESLWEAARIFTEAKIHALPVIEDGKPVGIITSNDVVKKCAEADEDVRIM